MNERRKKLLLSLRFIPFVLTNGMNFFPVLILAQVYLNYRDIDKYVLPLVLYFSFKTTILFLARLKQITVNHLLQFSIILGIIASFMGSFYEINLYFGLFSGALLGICSGLLYPSFLTVQFHEKTYNNFGSGKKDQLYAVCFAIVFSVILFFLSKHSVSATFIYLGVWLIVLLCIIRAYPSYEITDDEKEVSYPLFETLFLFLTGFFVIFIVKADKKLGMTHYLPVFFIFLVILIIVYFFFVRKIKPERRLTSELRDILIYKGMITNFILVFCPFYQLLFEGEIAVNKIYISYLVAITLAPIIYAKFLKKLSEIRIDDVIILGVTLGFILILWDSSFYIGVLVLSLFTSQLNLRLNQLVYNEAKLPKDHRLFAKYRLTNVGSILHQLMMIFIIYLVTLVSKTVTINELFQLYRYKQIDESAFLILNIIKWSIISIFLISLYILQKNYKKAD